MGGHLIDRSPPTFYIIYYTIAMLRFPGSVRKFSRKVYNGIRHSGSHAHDAPPATGLDGFVRKYLPGDHHVCNLRLKLIHFHSPIFV